MTDNEQTPVLTFRLDHNHLGVRVATLAALFVGACLSISLLPVLLRNVAVPWKTIGLLVIGLGVSIGLAWFAERYLRKVWPSGRELIGGMEGLVLRKKSGESVEIAWDGEPEIKTWHFTIDSRRASVPKGWHCTSLQLAQSDRLITVYAFMAPADFEMLPANKLFEELISRRETNGQKQAKQAIDEGPQAELWKAERNRWQGGAEMQPADFASLIHLIGRKAPSWLSGARSE
ncbi:MAG: hypothetical protein JXJ17_10040 [Anaerolineae bacterium]|nr:hypothetical protein [Anaerolineae bacterium]